MLSSDNLDRLKTVTATTLGVDEDEINENSSGATIASWTSFNHLTLMSAIEEEFGLTLSMEEMTGMKNFGDVAATVARHLNG